MECRRGPRRQWTARYGGAPRTARPSRGRRRMIPRGGPPRLPAAGLQTGSRASRPLQRQTRRRSASAVGVGPPRAAESVLLREGAPAPPQGAAAHDSVAGNAVLCAVAVPGPQPAVLPPDRPRRSPPVLRPPPLSASPPPCPAGLPPRAAPPRAPPALPPCAARPPAAPPQLAPRQGRSRTSSADPPGLGWAVLAAARPPTPAAARLPADCRAACSPVA
eukprot:scaffold3256_cov114-Isochrysis_galbana.AAC.14